MIPTLLGLSDQEYRELPGLSNSAMRDLAVSPYRYWYLHVNPERPVIEPTAEMRFGTALHMAILEPDRFLDCYAKRVSVADYEGCLVTIEDMREWLRDRGYTPKGTRKADLVAQVQAADSQWPILDVIERRHAAETAGKTLFDAADWARLYAAADSLRAEPEIQRIFEEAQSSREVAMFATDPATGVPLKARMDYVWPNGILDIKTFNQKRGKSIDRSVADAIYYEAYYRQAYFYSLIRGWPHNWDGDFILAFVESEAPHEVRIRSLRPKLGGSVCMYWERARIEVRGLIELYREHLERFGSGDKPWRYAAQIRILEDEEMPGMAY